MSKYRHHKYTWSKPFGYVRHNWELVGPRGAIHFHVSIVPEIDRDRAPSAGLEIHYRTPPGYMADQAPSQLACPLTGGWCWHDGTSLYASEELWPMIEGPLRHGDHEAIFRILESEADSRFEEEPRTTLALLSEAAP